MLTEGPVLTAVSTVIVAFITGILTYLGVRAKARTDVQSSLNTGFQSLISELQEERQFLSEQRDELQEHVKHLDQQVIELRVRVERLLQLTTTFHNFIVQNDLIPPPFDARDVIGDNSAATN